MAQEDNRRVTARGFSDGDNEAIAYLKNSLAAGRHWYLALLRAMGLWTSAEEIYQGRTLKYLIEGEAFDWLLLAERLLDTINGLLPEEERDALLLRGITPLKLTVKEVKELVGESKYRQYLNYFYGVTVEEALLLAVQEEIEKERHVFGVRVRARAADEAYVRIYEDPQERLLRLFRQEKKYPQTKSITLAEMKEFTYWLFKYRLKRCEKAKIASDTKKALDYLRRQWQKKGVSGVLAAETTPGEEP